MSFMISTTSLNLDIYPITLIKVYVCIFDRIFVLRINSFFRVALSKHIHDFIILTF